MTERVRGGPTAWRHHVPASPLRVEDEGALVDPATLTLNFTGPGVSAIPSGPGQVEISIPGGSAPPLQSQAFLDNAVVDLPVGAASDGLVSIDASISTALGAATAYRVVVAASGSGVDISVLQVHSDVPVLTVTLSAVLGGGQIFLRLTGSGPGTAAQINYRIVDTIPRAF